MPSRLIQAQHVQVTPVLLWQGCSERNPSCGIDRLWPDTVLLLACSPFGAPLGFLALLFGELQVNTMCAGSLAFVGDPCLLATHLSCFSTTAFEPADHIDRFSLLIL